jgi:hypothetical protein
MNIDGHVIFLDLSFDALLRLNSSVFPRLSRFSVVGFRHRFVPGISEVIFRGLSHFILAGFSHRLAGLSPGHSPGPDVFFGFSPFVVFRHGIFPGYWYAGSASRNR